jgi:hypothetical protein
MSLSRSKGRGVVMCHGHRVTPSNRPKNRRRSARNGRGHSVDPAGWLAEQIGACQPDVLRSMVKTMAEALMSAEADAACGAGYGQRSEERGQPPQRLSVPGLEHPGRDGGRCLIRQGWPGPSVHAIVTQVLIDWCAAATGKTRSEVVQRLALALDAWLDEPEAPGADSS